MTKRDGPSGRSMTDRDEKILSWMNLVWGIAKKYRGYGMDIEDLVGEGTVGLILAVDGFDASFGLSFFGYATGRIHYAILEALKAMRSTIRLPPHTFLLLKRFRRTRRALLAAGERATFDDVACAMRLSIMHQSMLMSALITIDIEDVHEYGGANDFGRREEIGSALEDAEIVAMRDRLEPRRRSVLSLRYDDGLFLAQVGGHHGMSREWARHEVDRALEAIREMAGLEVGAPTGGRRK